MEAIACGTPVIAFPAGALADIVEPGVTGYLVESVADMAEAIHAVDSLDREACREVARRRFGLERMVAGYFALYRRLARASRRGVIEIATDHGSSKGSPACDPNGKGCGAEIRWQRRFSRRLGFLPGGAFFGTSRAGGVDSPRRNGELVGLLPLYLLREPDCRKLLPIGVGLSDY